MANYQNQQGSWTNGVPDFVGLYTYFRSLQTSENPVSRKLYSKASSSVGKISSQLSNNDNIQLANEFMQKIAISERGKELAAIQAYCKQLNTSFPQLQSFIDDPETIYNDPQKFYTELTAAINEIRLGTQEYKNELERIKRNILNTKRNLHSYQADDYRYKLVQDITSFLSHLSGNHDELEKMLKHGYKGDHNFTSKMQNLAIKILNKMGVIDKINSGEDFAAIASSLLVDLEHSIQQELDNSPEEKRTLNSVSDELFQKVEDHYMTLLQSNSEKQTPVQRALSDINGIDFNRIVKNAKELLGIKTKSFIDENEKEQYLKEIRENEKQEDINLVNKFKRKINKNKVLKNNLNLIEFSISGSYKTKHGNIQELVRSAMGSKVKGNVGTDVITYTIDWETNTNTEAFNDLISNIGDEFSSVLYQTAPKKSSTKSAENVVTKMNDEVEKLIKEAEKKLKEEEKFKHEDLFIFHESLKLYSSAEKYHNPKSRGHGGFSGRSMNILSYITYLSSANNIGINNNPLSQDNLSLLAYNLIPGAIADDQKEPLQRYFSIYAGLLMFDDVAIMAKEAISEINNNNDVIGGKVRQVHLYSLNGIFVPSSMILTYISDSLSKIQHISPDDFAQAKITIKNPPQDPKDQEMTPGLWSSIASAALSSVQVKIILLQTFITFVNLLPFHG